ncbi:MAG TPA: hypothetical protein VKG84_14315, partial [Candidatus Acidoferrales bacterium]|nr:hypothetical protein [Candidatus Acidoferrales bacterium]
MSDRKPVFHDERKYRWSATRRALEISGAGLAVLLIVLAFGTIGHISLGDPVWPAFKPAVHAVKAKAPAKPVVVRHGRKKRVAALGKVAENYDPIQAAFYVSWDSTSFASLQQNYRHLDLLIPEEMHAISAEGRVIQEVDPKLVAWQSHLGIEIPTMPLVNDTDGNAWHAEELAKALENPKARRRMT